MATNWQIGDRINDRWEVRESPMRGGQGVVYVVYDREEHTVFAAKTFRDEVFARNPAVAERFEEEARKWVGLDLHPNIACAFFVEKIEGKPGYHREALACFEEAHRLGFPQAAPAIALCRQQLRRRT